MKRIVFFVLIILLANISNAQINERRVEISGSLTFGSFSTSYKSNTFSTEADGRVYLNTSLKIGYFLVKGFEIEPEIYTYFAEKNKPSFLFNGNLAYNHRIEETNFYPFILIGYGVGNSLPLITTINAYMRTSNEFNVGCLNAGTGIKYFISKNVGIRVEYRYQKYSDKNEESNGNYTYENEYQIKLHSFLFGLSVLLWKA